MSATSRLGLLYPAGTDPADVPQWMHDLAVQLDGMVGPVSHGTLAARPVSTVGSPGIADRFYHATDVAPASVVDPSGNGQYYRDTGTAWQAIGPYVSKVKIGTMISMVATGNVDIVGLGFQPKLVKFVFGYNDQSDAAFEMGQGAAMSSTNRYCFYIRGSSGAELRRRFYNNRCIVSLDSSGNIAVSADLVSMLADGFRLNFTVTSAGYSLHQISWEAWG
jgi:hypothetical protein